VQSGAKRCKAVQSGAKRCGAHRRGGRGFAQAQPRQKKFPLIKWGERLFGKKQKLCSQKTNKLHFYFIAFWFFFLFFLKKDFLSKISWKIQKFIDPLYSFFAPLRSFALQIEAKPRLRLRSEAPPRQSLGFACAAKQSFAEEGFAPAECKALLRSALRIASLLCFANRGKA
jgi:hypothetical protein